MKELNGIECMGVNLTCDGECIKDGKECDGCNGDSEDFDYMS